MPPAVVQTTSADRRGLVRESRSWAVLGRTVAQWSGQQEENGLRPDVPAGLDRGVLAGDPSALSAAYYMLNFAIQIARDAGRLLVQKLGVAKITINTSA